MHLNNGTYYEIDRRHREEALQRKLEAKNWVDQVNPRPRKKRSRWRMYLSMLIGFFV